MIDDIILEPNPADGLQGHNGIRDAIHNMLTPAGNRDGGKPRPTLPGTVILRTSRWTVTDPSCRQRCRIHTYDDGTREYEYEQTMDGITGRASIRLSEYVDWGDPLSVHAFERDYLHAYGFGNTEQLKAACGKNWEQIAAECIFETDFYEL